MTILAGLLYNMMTILAGTWYEKVLNLHVWIWGVVQINVVGN